MDLSQHSLCPHCSQQAGPWDPGAIVDCPHCDRSFVVPGEPTPAPPGISAQPARPRAAAVASTDVPLATTGLAAGLSTAFFYAALVRPLAESYFGQLFGARGWVPYVISFLALWSALLLVSKYRRLARQQRALEVDLLPRQIAARVTPETAPAFLAHLRSIAPEHARNFLVQRICRALEHFCARANVAETVDQLRSQSERDESDVESSYTMLRVFIWAIPILGFIGTVVGIGASVGGFSESVATAASLDVMKDSIGAVTSGLGVAFDTTLLALVMSIFIMFPTSSLQKAEQDYLARVEDYCRQHLIARLDDGAATPGESDQLGEALLARVADRLAEALVAAVERRLPKVH